ncbi:MAG: RloB family protein, partial [Rikenellaceae bacterium]
KEDELKSPPSEGFAVVCEGATEVNYMQSIQGLLKAKVTPAVSKDGIDYLIAEVEKCVKTGYETIFVLVDKDKYLSNPKEYTNFVARYGRDSNGDAYTEGCSKVVIIENHPCIEIWFYYYYDYTTGVYNSYDSIDPLKEKLRTVLPGYDKPDKINGNRVGGLHSYLTYKSGDLNIALENSKKSMISHANGGAIAFSEMKIMFDMILKESVKSDLEIYQKEEAKTLAKEAAKAKYGTMPSDNL